ncbi:hypothetical protein Tco_1267641, partial [Tanacetum coccineum]
MLYQNQSIHRLCLRKNKENVKNTNVIAPRMYRMNTKAKADSQNSNKEPNEIASISTGVASVTDVKPLNASNANVSVACVSCCLCVMSANHDKCVAKYLLSVKLKAKKPLVANPLVPKPVVALSNAKAPKQTTSCKFMQQKAKTSRRWQR